MDARTKPEAPRARPPELPKSAEPAGPIEIRIDDRFRLISAAMLLTRWGVAGTFAPTPPKLRTLEWLAPYASLPAMRFFQRMSASIFIWGFYCLAAHRGGPPDFAPSSAPGSIDRRPLYDDLTRETGLRIKDIEAGLTESMAALYAQADFAGLWEATAPDWEAVRAQAQRVLEASGAGAWLEEFFGPLELRPVLVPMPTDPIGQGFGVDDGLEMFTMVGPPAVDRHAGGAGLWMDDGQPSRVRAGRDDRAVLLGNPFDYSLCPSYMISVPVRLWISQLITHFVVRDMGLERTTREFEELKGPLVAEVLRLWEGRAEPTRGDLGGVGPRAASGRRRAAVVHEALADYIEGRRTGRYACLSEFGAELRSRFNQEGG